MSRFKRSIFICLALILLGSAFAGCGESAENTLPTLTVDILKIGKADAIILRENERCMIIDAGEEDDGPEVCEFLTKNGITEVEALIITHYDKDHVGGADMLIEQFPVKRVLVPDYEGTVTDYSEFVSALDAAGIVPERISATLRFSFGSADVLVEPPSAYPDTSTLRELDNDCSLITLVTHGSNRLLFMGDAEKARIRDWLAGENATECDFMKLPHHGVYNNALGELMASARPRYVAICSSDKNPADEKTLELLGGYGTDVRETRNGRITLVSNGVNITYSQKLK